MRNETMKDINLERLKRGKPIRTSHGYVNFVDDPERDVVEGWFIGNRDAYIISFPGKAFPRPITPEKIMEHLRLTPDLYERYKDVEPLPINFRDKP